MDRASRGKGCVHQAGFFSIPHTLQGMMISLPLWPLVLAGLGPHKEPNSGLRHEEKVSEVGRDRLPAYDFPHTASTSTCH